MVELRKRKAPASTTAPSSPPVKKANSVKSSTSSKKGDSSTNGSAAIDNGVTVGSTITVDNFGGEIETNDGEKTTMKKLMDESKSGVVLFTFPKASTPGCRYPFRETLEGEAVCVNIDYLTSLGTTQACLFRDEFAPLTSTGYSIYGLSTDYPKSNTNFKTKHNLPYILLCDPAATLIGAIGMKKAPSGTIRGVFVVNKDAKVEAITPGGPAATVDVVRKIVGEKKVSENVENLAGIEKVEKDIEEGSSAQEAEEYPKANRNETQAEVAAEVADSAQKLDGP